MALLIKLTENLEEKLNQKAENLQSTPQQVAVEILAQALEEGDYLSVAEVVKQIQMSPGDSSLFTPAKGSLADALRNGPTDPNFDLEEWETNWQQAENEIKRVQLLDQPVTFKTK